MIIGKSNHPVEVKKIRLKVWRLRHEVERAIEIRKQECQIQDIPEYYDDIDFFYNHKAGQEENVVSIKSGKKDGSAAEGSGETTLQPEVGEIDDDMLAMQAALTGGEESKDEESKDEESKDEESKDEESKDEESKDEESKDEESKDEESKDEESKDEESKDEESKDEEPKDSESHTEKSEEDIMAAAAAMMDDIPISSESESSEEPKEVFNPALPIKDIPKNADESLEFHLTFPRTMPDDELQASCFCFLADVDMTSIRIFSTKPFTYGQTVVVDFHIPIRFQLVGEVKNCHNLNMKTRIISETKPNYRLLIKFGFKRPGERTNLRKFLKSVEPSIPAPVKKKKENADEELDELDF